MRITMCGAAGEVTGSGYLVETEQARVLVDFGIFQGKGATDEKNRRLGPVDARQLDAVVLTHAHLDHSGRLPLLARHGYRRPIYATPATIDLADLLLLDSAHLAEADAERDSRRRGRRGQPPVSPLYEVEDVETLRPRFTPILYVQTREIADGVDVRLVNAGHMLGSASIEMTVRQGASRRTIVFSGDLGPRGLPFLRDPTPLERADLVFLESTYGDRDHRPMNGTLREFRSILNEAYKARERVLIPAFAIGRSQQILFHIAELVREGSVPRFPIYLDSPMAIEATFLYRKHQELFDDEAGRLYSSRQLDRDLSALQYTRTAEESKALNNLRDAAVIIAGSGMCEGGRIVHHLRHNLSRSYANVVFVGYQAAGTLGERLVHGAKEVRIFGESHSVRAEIHTLGGFSGHAGQTELVGWAGHLMATKPRIVLTHGEDRQRAALREKLVAAYGVDVQLPQQPGAIITIE
jgi:metallo-beta-lactamase family protein